MQGKLHFISGLAKNQLYIFNNYLALANEPWCYHTQFSYHLHIKGLVLPLFFKTIQTVANRHPVLKTVFLTEDPSYLQQGINPEFILKVGYQDISDLNAQEQEKWLLVFLLKDRNKPFVAEGNYSPLVRFYLVRRDAERVQLILVMHHAIWDGWSLAVLLKEIFAHYQELLVKPTLSLEPAPYDYQEYLKSESTTRYAVEAKIFWQKQLEKFQEYYPQQRLFGKDYDTYTPAECTLSNELVIQLEKVRQKLRVTMKAIYLAIYIRLIQEETQLDYTTIGVVTNGRGLQLTNPLTTLGLLWNMAPLCLEYLADTEEHIKLVNRKLAEIAPFGSYPLLDIFEDNNRTRLFHAAFNYINFEGASLLSPDSDVQFLEVGGLDKFHHPLHLLVGKNPFNKDITLVVNYDTRFYAHVEIESKLTLFIRKLKEICFVSEA